jgi:hypothetical protein
MCFIVSREKLKGKRPSSESCQWETLRQEPEPDNLAYLNLYRSVKRNLSAALNAIDEIDRPSFSQ